MGEALIQHRQAKFIQLVSRNLSRNLTVGGSALYALDEDGKVWCLDGQVWYRVTDKRISTKKDDTRTEKNG